MYRLLSRCTLHPIFSIVVSMLTEVSIKLSFYRIIFCSILPWCDSMSEALSDITSVCLMRTECTSHKANRCTVETVLFCLFEVLFPCVYSQWSHIETAFLRLLSYCCTRAARVHYYVFPNRIENDRNGNSSNCIRRPGPFAMQLALRLCFCLMPIASISTTSQKF